MLRFATPDGQDFQLDYLGPICVFDSQTNRIAICPGEWREASPVVAEEFDRLGLDNVGPEGVSGHGDPARMDDWELIVALPEEQARLLQAALASAWSAVYLCQRILVEHLK